MPLNDLSLEELTELTGTLQQLQEVGQQLAGYGLAPEFDLTPGGDMVIRLAAQMPEAPGQATKEDVARIEAKLDQRLERQVFVVEGHRTAEAIQAEQVMNEGESVAEGIARIDKTTDVLWHRDEDLVNRLARLEMALWSVAHLEMPDLGAFRLTDHSDVPPPVQPPIPSIEAAPDLTQSGEAGAAMPEPLEPPAPDFALSADMAGGTLSADPSRSDDDPATLAGPASDEGAAESGGGEAVAAAQPPAAAAPAPATHQTSFGQTAWTETEDAELIRLTVFGMVKMGLGKTAAMRTAAKGVGRSEQGSAFRMHHKLKARFEAALTEAAGAQAATETPEADPIPAEGAAAGEGATPPAVQPVPDEPDLDAKSRAAAIAHGTHPDAAPAPVSVAASPVVGHLMSLPDKGGWTLERDLELMEMSIDGWQPNEIALQLKVQASAVKPRFDALTGLFEDADGKKVRRFKREDVFAALKALTAAGKAA